MATGETGFDDVTYDLVSVQYHSLKAGDSRRTQRCHEFLRDLGGTDNTGPRGEVSGGADPNDTTRADGPA